MEGVISVYNTLWEKPLDKLGLLYTTPMRRFAVITTAAGVALWIIKPRSLFTDDGNPRPSLISDSDQSVPVNWVLASGLIGALSVLF